MSRSDTAILAATLVVAAALRFHGLDWGLPDLFEEATPFFRAWEMAGWGGGRPLDPDPHFYRYPSLTFYVHLAAHSLLVAAAWVRGGVEAVRDVPVEFLADRTRFLYASRTVSALFGVAAVAGAWAAGRRLGGAAVGGIAAVLLAVNPEHVARSQFIDVDGPLACFVVWGLWACLRLADSGSLRTHAVAGALTGLATSAKYPGAMLAMPLLVAHAVGVPRGAPWRRRVAALAVAGATALAAFTITSPFVAANVTAAAAELAAERQHMERGHFGQEETATWAFYARHLATRTLGPLLAAAAIAGAALGLARRNRGTVVVLSLAVVAAFTFGAWRMQSPRYLWPIAMPLLLLGAAFAGEMARMRPLAGRRGAVLVGATALLAAPGLLRLPEAYARLGPDPRSEARAWIESRFPAGSFLVMEAWGPDLLEPIDLWALSPDQRSRWLEQPGRPLYAVLNLPTFQVMPEMSEAFYDLDLYRDADAFVLSSNVGDRYRREPRRFARQLAFYDSVSARCGKVAEFGTAERGPEDPPRITVYQALVGERPPFASRGTSLHGPVAIAQDRRRPAAGEAAFFHDLGLNYETFGFLPEAMAAYGRAIAAGDWPPGGLPEVAVGLIRCLRAQGRYEEAVELADGLVDKAALPQDAAKLREIAARLRADAAARKAGGG